MILTRLLTQHLRIPNMFSIFTYAQHYILQQRKYKILHYCSVRVRSDQDTLMCYIYR